MKGQNNFWKQNAFLTYSWRFLITIKLEQLELKLEKFIVIKKHAGKVRKHNNSNLPVFTFRLHDKHAKKGKNLLIDSNVSNGICKI